MRTYEGRYNEHNRPAGKYNVKVIIQQNTPTQTGDGAMVNGPWTMFKSVWAYVIPRSGKETFMAGKETPAGDTSIFIRFTDGVTAQMRVLVGGVVYSIDAPPVNRQFRNFELELICSTGKNDG